MFVIYGSRYYFQKRKVKSFGQCLACNGFGWQKSYDGSNMGHLYFIPLIPLGGRKRVLKSCPICDKMLVVDHEASLAMKESLKGSLEQCVSLFKQGETHMPSENGEPPELIENTLFSSIDMLVALDGQEDVETLIAYLERENLGYLLALTKAAYLHTQGPNAGAEEFYLQAIDQADDPAFMMTVLPRYYMSVGENTKAITGFEHVANMNPDDPHPVLNLIDLYTNTKQFDKAVEKWHRVFEIQPLFKSDKKLWKLYTKACKKAGQQPIEK